ncbi:MAG: S8 family serine peptidase, partial [Ktedonobacteraceae bacterium]|nr:S8 family serine peptidase [Ktedonobacteraceae bacterium]
PAAHIKDYQTDISKITTYGDFWGRFNDSLQHILDDNAASPSQASAVSISLGGSEETLTGEVAKATSQRIQLLTLAEHMTVYVASGDCGAFTNGAIGSLSTSYPSTDPLAVSVGGTTILPTREGTSDRYKEISWTGVPTSVTCQNDWGSGGGLSKLFKKPAWQQGPGVNNRYSNGHRQVPDIAAIADNVPVFLDGKWISLGGTSAATPIWAAGMALVNQGLLATKGLYVYGPDTFYFVQAHGGNLKPYYDEVEGTNLYYFAGPGWDYTTGLGSPNLSSFYQTLYNTATV